MDTYLYLSSGLPQQLKSPLSQIFAAHFSKSNHMNELLKTQVIYMPLLALDPATVSSCTSSSTQTPYHSPRTQEAGPRPTPLSPLVLRTGACYLILEAQILALCIPFPLTEGFFCPSGVLVDATCLSFRALSAGHLFREGFLGSCPHSHTNNLVSDNPALL